MFRARGGWWIEAGLAAAFALFTWMVASGLTDGIDLAVADWCLAHHTFVTYWLARGLNYLGQGSLLTLTGLVLSFLLWRRVRRWIAFLPMVVAYALTYATLGPLKLWSQRDAPTSKLPNRVEFFNQQAEYTLGYPSGHVVNAIVWWGVFAILLRKKSQALRVVPPVIVLFTTTYLGFHWLTDGIAAILLGLLLDRLIHRFQWDFG